MSIQRLNAPDLRVPQGYTHLSVADGGTLVHLAGQAGTDRSGRLAVGLAAQTEQALRNLLTALEAAGGGPEHLVKLTLLVVDWDQSMQPELGSGLAALEGALPPLPMTLIGVNSLFFDDMLIEVEGVAVLPQAS